jgi:hypothetical protein
MGVRLGPFSSIVVFAVVGGRGGEACIIVVLKLAERDQSHASDVGCLVTSLTLLNVYCPPPPPPPPPPPIGQPIALRIVLLADATIVIIIVVWIDHGAQWRGVTQVFRR